MGKGKDLKQRKRRTNAEMEQDRAKSVKDKQAKKQHLMKMFNNNTNKRKAPGDGEVVQTMPKTTAPVSGQTSSTTARDDESRATTPPCQDVDDDGRRHGFSCGTTVMEQGYKPLLTGWEPTEAPNVKLGDQIIDWQIMVRDEMGSRYRWRRGVVEGRGETDPGLCRVTFGSESEDLELSYDLYGDGTENASFDAHCWFRVCVTQCRN